MRKRKSGETSIASSASWMPSSKSALRSPLLVEREQRVESASVTGRRNARRASAVRMLRAQAGSCAGCEARHTKILARLGVSPRPVGVYGPPTIELVDLRRRRRDHFESLQPRAVEPQVDGPGDLGRAAAPAGTRLTAGWRVAFGLRSRAVT